MPSRKSSPNRTGWLPGLALSTLALLLAAPTASQVSPTTYRGAEEIEAVVPFVFEGPLTDLPVVERWRPGDPIKEIPRRQTFAPAEPPSTASPPGRRDRLLELQERLPEAPAVDGFLSPIVNREGQDFTGAFPPDTVGDVGLDYFIQVVNSASGGVFAVYDKVDGELVVGPIALDSLGPAGSNCSSGSGDGIVLFDHLADRWLLTEFNSEADSVCVYVSMAANPVATDWYVYEFASLGFPDYPKYAVWPDAYYLSTNEFFPGLYAFDRSSMLNGAPASVQRFDVDRLRGFGFQALTPADLDGANPPPPGSPGLFLRHRDTEAHGPPGQAESDTLEIWEFAVNWDSPAGTTLTGPLNVYVSEFDSRLCVLSPVSCIPQPQNAVPLDPLTEVIMHRLQYRNFGTWQTLVGNLVTDVDGTDHAGVRWFELRDEGAGWSLHQEGTFAPDEHHRWMAAVAMDTVGNIALGYNVSSSSVAPGLRYTGRRVGDFPGVMTQPETTLIAGSAANASNRYGDYSSMSVDPVDDCTFWFTGEHNQSSAWSTRIGSFRFDSCSLLPGFTLDASPAALEICTPQEAEFAVEISPIQDFGEEVLLSLAEEPAGSLVSFAPNPVLPGSASLLTLANTDGMLPGEYLLEIVGSASSGQRSRSVSLQLVDAEPPSPELLTPVNRAEAESLRPTFAWSDVGGIHTLEIAGDREFTQIVLVETGLTEATYRLPFDLVPETTYYWRVRAENVCGRGLDSPVWSFATVPVPGRCVGSLMPTVEFFDDVEGGVGDWRHGGLADTWEISTARSRSGESAWFAIGLDELGDQHLITPPIYLPTGQRPLALQFWHWQDIESKPPGCYDGAVVEISADSGTSWTRLESELLTDPYDGPVDTAYGNPIAGEEAWCGNPQDWFESIVDLSAWAGDTVEIRFRLATDELIGTEGWYIDDIGVLSCRDEVFSDDLETGDTGRWDGTVSP